MRLKSSGAKAFSRVEAIAVLATVGLLTGLALPLLATNVTTARSALCMDNLRRLATALDVRTSERLWYPPNPDDGNSIPGLNWVPGSAGPGALQEFNDDIVMDPRVSLVVPYLEDQVGNVFRCPADLRIGKYSGAVPEKSGTRVLAARSVAMNGAFGVNPRASGMLPVDGPWLDNKHSHTYGMTWRTYGRPEQIVAPSPSQLFVFIDEDAMSINDGHFSMGMEREEWIDWPGTRHDMGATLSYADGHVEVRRWVDRRTAVYSSVARLPVPGSPDYAWLQARTSARIVR